MAAMGVYQAPIEWKLRTLSSGVRGHGLNVNSVLNIVSVPSWCTWKRLYILR
jgi:hypothetical protein